MYTKHILYIWCVNYTSSTLLKINTITNDFTFYLFLALKHIFNVKKGQRDDRYDYIKCRDFIHQNTK